MAFHPPFRVPFDGERLAGALRATFERRRTVIPAEPPIALTAAFADVEGKRAQWAGFVRRNSIEAAPADLAPEIDGIASFAGPVLAAVGRRQVYSGSWSPGGPWMIRGRHCHPERENGVMRR